VVVNVNINYKAPAKVYDTLVIHTSTKSSRNTSARRSPACHHQRNRRRGRRCRGNLRGRGPRDRQARTHPGQLRELLGGTLDVTCSRFFNRVTRVSRSG